MKMGTTSPRPNGFPSPPRVSCPNWDVRFAHCGPPKSILALLPEWQWEKRFQRWLQGLAARAGRFIIGRFRELKEGYCYEGYKVKS